MSLNRVYSIWGDNDNEHEYSWKCSLLFLWHLRMKRSKIARRKFIEPNYRIKCVQCMLICEGSKLAILFNLTQKLKDYFVELQEVSITSSRNIGDYSFMTQIQVYLARTVSKNYFR